MANTRISSYLPPDIDPTKAPIAFGERALPKLKEELGDPKLITRQRALMALCDLVHDPENVYKAVTLGFLESLKYLLYDQDCTVREKTTEVFYIIAGHNIGREGILRSDIIVALSQLLGDPVAICRRNVHQTFEMLAELPAGSLGTPSATDRTCCDQHSRADVYPGTVTLSLTEGELGLISHGSAQRSSAAPRQRRTSLTGVPYILDCEVVKGQLVYKVPGVNTF